MFRLPPFKREPAPQFPLGIKFDNAKDIDRFYEYMCAMSREHNRREDEREKQHHEMVTRLCEADKRYWENFHTQPASIPPTVKETTPILQQLTLQEQREAKRLRRKLKRKHRKERKRSGETVY